MTSPVTRALAGSRWYPSLMMLMDGHDAQVRRLIALTWWTLGLEEPLR